MVQTENKSDFKLLGVKAQRVIKHEQQEQIMAICHRLQQHMILQVEQNALTASINMAIEVKRIKTLQKIIAAGRSHRMASNMGVQVRDEKISKVISQWKLQLNILFL